MADEASGIDIYPARTSSAQSTDFPRPFERNRAWHTSCLPRQCDASRHFRNLIKLAVATTMGIAAFQPISAVAQETRSEISIQGTGFFTKDSDGNGVRNHVTNTGGFLISYR